MFQGERLKFPSLAEGLRAGLVFPVPDPIPEHKTPSNPTLTFCICWSNSPAKSSSVSAPAFPSLPVPHPQLPSKAPPGPVWEKVNWKSPFAHQLGFSFHTVNWSIIHLLWQSSALGTELSGGLDFMAPPAPAGGEVLMYSFVPG